MIRIGIDLGTTNTVAACHGNALTLPTEGGVLLPSVVAYLPSGVTAVGTLARRRRALDSRNTIFSAKRLIGRSWHAAEVARFGAAYPFELVRSDDGGAAFKTRVGVVTPEQIGTAVLRRLLDDLHQTPAEVSAVVAVPAEFHPEERRATARAVGAAGVGMVRIIDEPLATARAYLRESDQAIRTAVVYDFGGGTFDVAVVDCSQPEFHVVAHGGDSYLGGDDIDRAIADWAADKVLSEHRWDLRDDKVVFDRLVVECERAKVRLSFADQARIDLAQVDPSGALGAETLLLEAALLRDISDELVRRSFSVCDEVLARAKVTAAQIDAVFLAGGTTMLERVRSGIAQYFGRAPRSNYDPMEVVAIGASLGPA